jgi:hypothetical protein
MMEVPPHSGHHDGMCSFVTKLNKWEKWFQSFQTLVGFYSTSISQIFEVWTLCKVILKKTLNGSW